jgi:SP family general alpha glucoside:H+ symporter-like MFS transporter
MEITPNRIRGGMVTFQAVWYVYCSLRSSIFAIIADLLNRSNIGGIICAVMMQQLNSKYPDNYLLAMRVLWAPIGLMIICWALIPESPWYHARHGNKEKAMNSLRQLFGGVEGYDFEEEYGIIARTIEHERSMQFESPSYIQIFKGLNLVSNFILSKTRIMD